MPVKQTIPFSFGTFFITFTCHRWLPLIALVKGYDIIYKWFDYLKSAGHYINGYVIMPNHVHVMISFRETTTPINSIIGNGKRFMAYEIVNRLKQLEELNMLKDMEDAVETARKRKNKKHEVWELSFDWKECNSDHFIWQKLDYIHANPCSGKWNLCSSPGEYQHSSAYFYEMGVHGIYNVDHIECMKDVVLMDSNKK